MKILKGILNKLLNICFYLCLLVLLWGTIQLFCFTSFHIPTDSMEPALIPGDNIIVNKMVGGARLFDIVSALNREEFRIYRMPGISSFKRNDVLVFNYPYPRTRDHINFDAMKYYVKRCIGLPGDTLEIRNSFFYIRGVGQELGNIEMQDFISNLSDTAHTYVQRETFPYDSSMGWTIKEFGPLPVPAKGQVVEMNKLNTLLYRNLIEWEQKKRPEIKESGDIYLGDSLITNYCFQQNYYFMGGDRLIISEDSRYWGLLPEEFIVGRADYVWLSKKKDERKIRWERFMHKIQ